MVADLETICVGNELLIGKVLNTNAQWIGKYATNLGINVKRVTVIADNIRDIATAIREALQRKPRFIITTGGLGPTFDDKTLEGIAIALNRKLEVNNEALEMVKRKYAAYEEKNRIEPIKLTPPRIKMATLPQNVTPIRNPVGTAPGVRIDLDETILFVLPGVPTEVEAIFEETIAPLLEQAGEGTAFYETSIYVDHAMESVIAPLIDKTMQDNAFIYIKSHPKHTEDKPHIELHFSTSAKRTENPNERLQKAITQLSHLIESAGGKIILAQ